MTQVILHCFHIVPILEGQDGVGMAEIMDPGLGRSYCGGQLLEVDKDGLRVQMPTQVIGKDDGGLPLLLDRKSVV